MSKPVVPRQVSFLATSNMDAISAGELRLIAELILHQARPQGGWRVRIIVVPEAEIIQLNQRVFNRDRSTDVISCNITTAEAPVLEGEVYISYETALRQAREYKVSPGEELQRLTAHGLYHLLGYEDGDARQKEVMSALEDEAMQRLRSFGRK